MSVTHLIVPFDGTLRVDAFTRWYEGDIPANGRQGRLPTLSELKVVMERYTPTGYEVTYHTAISPDWYAEISREFSEIDFKHVKTTYKDCLIRVEAFGLQADGETVGYYSFQGDRLHLHKLIEMFPYNCGTFLVITNGEDPEFVTSGSA